MCCADVAYVCCVRVLCVRVASSFCFIVYVVYIVCCVHVACVVCGWYAYVVRVCVYCVCKLCVCVCCVCV